MEHLNIIDIIQNNKEKISIDKLLFEYYKKSNINITSFEDFKKDFLLKNNINEYEYYTSNVNKEIKDYINLNIFPKYEKNDKAHGIIHIKEVIRRAFALKYSLELDIDLNMLFVICAYHDLGKYIDHTIHEKIAADLFFKDKNMESFFALTDRIIIKEAIEDHRSSFNDTPRSIYGKLISSADRNTSIEMVFIRSFFVAKSRMPEYKIEDYLEYTYLRLAKRYSEEKPENMFFEDNVYITFLNDMRKLLKNKEGFKNLYCEINKITNRNLLVRDY